MAVLVAHPNSISSVSSSSCATSPSRTTFTGWGKTLVSTYVVTAYNKKGYVLVFNSIHDGETPLPQCLARHQEESDEAFEYILRTVTFRPAPPSSSSASLPSSASSFFSA